MAPRIKFLLRPQQQEILNNLKRFNVCICHRRFGKTYFAIVWLLKSVHENPKKNVRGYYFSPTFGQSKRVSWQYLKDFTRHLDGVKVNEAELRINWLDKQIQLGSADNPDSFRGIYIDHCVADEPAQFPPRMMTEVMRPAMSDRNGDMLMIGTPNGRHGTLFEAWENAATDPLWARFMYKASETGIISHDELQANRRAMTRAEYNQEFEVSFDAAIRGAFWGETMAQLEEKGHLRNIAYDEQHLVHCSFDLGINDATAVWFFQVIGNELSFINYLEFTNTGLPDMIGHLNSLEYHYGKFIFPHDVNVRSLSTGQTRLDTLRNLGVDVVVAPNIPVIDGIDAARSLLQRCFFDVQQCKDGIEALRQYRSDWDDKHGTLRLKPLHDWSSHGADSFRYLAITPVNMLNNTWSTEINYDKMNYAY